MVIIEPSCFKGAVADDLLVPLAMSIKNLRIHVNEIALHSTPSTFDMMSGNVSCLHWNSSACRTETLARCVEAAKAYLDRYFTLSPDHLRNFSFLEHVKSFYALLTISIYAAGVDSPMAEQLQASANMDFYISGVIDRATQLITVQNGEEQVDFFWRFRSILNNTRRWFVDQGQQGNMLHQGRLEADLSFGSQEEGFDQGYPMGQPLPLEGTDEWGGDMMADDWQFDLDFDPNAVLLYNPI